MELHMRGRQVFMDSLVAHGVEYIFGNPGTTESPLLDALSDYPKIQYRVALHEGVATGAASYYAQASGKTGIVNLHVAPGLGNAIGMAFCALRAATPLIITAGQQDTRLRLTDPVLGHDLVAMAKPVTKWSVQVERADEFAPIMRRAFKIANEGVPGPVFVGLPIDVMEQETAIRAAPAGPIHRAEVPRAEAIAAFAKLLLSAKAPVVICGDDVGRAGAGAELVALVERIGATVWYEGIRGQASFPTSHANARAGLPPDADAVRKSLEGADLVLLVGGPFFEDVWYAPGGHIPEGAKVVQIEQSADRVAYNLPLAAGLTGALGPTVRAVTAAFEKAATPDDRSAAERRNQGHAQVKARDAQAQKDRLQKAWDRVPTSMARAMAEIKAGAPKDVVVVDESITASIDLARTFDFDTPGTFFSGRGGGIGQGLAGAIGVQVAFPKKPVLCISGDGSAMYSIQALWSAAHHDLPIVFVILANREYRILKHNLDAYRTRFDARSNKPYAQMDLTGPQLGFVDLAKGMGVAGTLVTKAEEIKAAVQVAFKSKKPHVIEIAIEGKR
jgi:benzoylformate decarboxylase